MRTFRVHHPSFWATAFTFVLTLKATASLEGDRVVMFTLKSAGSLDPISNVTLRLERLLFSDLEQSRTTSMGAKRNVSFR